MKVKHWTCCVLTAALLSVGGMAQAEKLVLSDGLSLDLGANTYVVSGKNTYFGKQIAKNMENADFISTLYARMMQVNEETNSRKGTIVFLPDEEKTKKFSQTMLDLMKTSHMYQVNLKEEGTWYQAMVMEGNITNEQLDFIQDYSKELVKYNISKLEKEKGDPELIKLLKEELKELEQGGLKSKVHSVEELNQRLGFSQKFMPDKMAWNYKVYSAQEKTGTLGKDKKEYALLEVRKTMTRGDFELPTCDTSLIITSKEGIHFIVFMMDQPSGKRISKIVDKAMKGATYEK